MNVTKRRFTRRRLIASAGLLAGAPSFRIADAADETYTMRLSVTTAPNSIFDLTARRFAAGVERESKGQLKIEVYPGGQLAKQNESVDGISTGVIDLTIQASALMVSIFPQWQVFDLPFLFGNRAAVYRVIDGPIGSELFAQLDARNIIGLSWVTDGNREFETSNRPITVPEDLKGLRIRVVSGGIYADIYQTLGAIPITIDGTETFTALTQHTIDALDISLDSIVQAKYSSVIRHVAMSNHATAIVPLMGSKRKIEALPLNLQKVLKNQAKAVLPYCRSLGSQRDTESIQSLKRDGVAFTEIQYPQFRKAVEPIYVAYKSKLGARFVDRVVRAAAI